jgi:hypothetical protein
MSAPLASQQFRVMAPTYYRPICMSCIAAIWVTSSSSRDASAARRQASRNWTFCALRTMHLHARLIGTESALGSSSRVKASVMRLLDVALVITSL